MTTTDSRDESQQSPESRRIRRALGAVSREIFALDDDAKHTGLPRLAAMLEALEPTGGESILLVGAKSGYVAAVLAHLCGEVRAMVDDAEQVEATRANLEAAGLGQIDVHPAGDEPGWPADAPYDAILAWQPEAHATEELADQLAEGGRLVIAARSPEGGRDLVRLTRRGEDDFERETLGDNVETTRLGDIIVSLGLADREAVERVVEQADLDDRDVGEALIRGGVVDENEVYRALAAQHSMLYARAGDLHSYLDASLLELVAPAYLEDSSIIPVCKADARLVVATSEPDVDASELSAAVGASSVRPYLVSPTDLERLRSELGLETTTIDGEQAHKVGRTAATSVSTGSEDSPPVEQEDMGEVLAKILLDAAGERATDVHLERYEDEVRVRFRVDGDLHDVEYYSLTPDQLQGVVNVLKVRCGLDLAERRLPQDGRLRREIAERTYDLRVHIQPAFYAEHAAIRLLPQQKGRLSIEDLGFPPKVAKTYRRLVESPGGLILVVGPTGAGKTTTLYAALKALAADSTRKVITVEDPVEYAMRDIEQTQVDADAGFDFADAMRAFVREDPDVILVGEIRDEETALEAIRASQTGHLVLSTLHANDTVDAVQRLIDLGLSPNSIASELLAVFAQALAKRNCAACRQPVEPDPKLLAELFPTERARQDFQPYAGEGCAVCDGRGTRGRIAAVEFLQTGAEMRKAIGERLQVDELRQVALEEGLVTLRSSALRLVLEGQIPMSELSSLLSLERMAPERDVEDSSD